MKVLISRMLHTAAFTALLAGTADAAAPGARPGDTTAPRSTAPVVPHALRAAKCHLKGTWDSVYGATITMKTKSKGTYVASYCASPWKVLATAQNKTGFTVEMTYTGSDGCQAFSETMTYSGCSAASGSYTNADGSTGTDSWTKVAAAKYTVPAGSLQQGLK